MHRTQLYLDDNLWTVLHVRARQESTSISELVRQAVRAQYADGLERQRRAMAEFAGSGKGRGEKTDAVAYVRRLRRSARRGRLR